MLGDSDAIVAVADAVKESRCRFVKANDYKEGRKEEGEESIYVVIKRVLGKARGLEGLVSPLVV